MTVCGFQIDIDGSYMDLKLTGLSGSLFPKWIAILCLCKLIVTKKAFPQTLQL